LEIFLPSATFFPAHGSWPFNGTIAKLQKLTEKWLRKTNDAGLFILPLAGKLTAQRVRVISKNPATTSFA
jgi:hypothetical protein